jgi:hypothetical protein
MTPLHAAAFWGREPAAAALLTHGADVNAKDKDGCGGPLVAILSTGRRALCRRGGPGRDRCMQIGMQTHTHPTESRSHTRTCTKGVYVAPTEAIPHTTFRQTHSHTHMPHKWAHVGERAHSTLGARRSIGPLTKLDRFLFRTHTALAHKPRRKRADRALFLRKRQTHIITLARTHAHANALTHETGFDKLSLQTHARTQTHTRARARAHTHTCKHTRKRTNAKTQRRTRSHT